MYEFYEKNSSLCKAMDKPFEKLATQYKGRADFCKLDVDNFEVHAMQAAQPSVAIHART